MFSHLVKMPRAPRALSQDQGTVPSLDTAVAAGSAGTGTGLTSAQMPSPPSRVFSVRVPSTSPPSSAGYPSSASSSSSSSSSSPPPFGLCVVQPGGSTTMTTPEAPRHRAGHDGDGDGHPMAFTASAATGLSSLAAPLGYGLPEQWDAHRRLADSVFAYKVVSLTSHLRTGNSSNVPDTPAVGSIFTGRMKVFADEREWNPMQQSDGVSVYQDAVVDDVPQRQSRSEQHRQQEQLPTPAATPAKYRLREVFAETWIGKCFHSSEPVTPAQAKEDDDNSLDTPKYSEEPSPVGTHDGADNHHHHRQPRRDTPHQPPPPSGRTPQRSASPVRPALPPGGAHDIAAAAATQRVRGARVRKDRRPRRRRRTEAELTMYHAIRWLSMGDVVPNVSVVTGGPLVRMPLPCTFGDGPSGGKRKEEEEEKGEEEDLGVVLARKLVRYVKKRRAERVRGKGKGKGS